MFNFYKNIDNHFLIRIIKDEVNEEEKEFFEKWLSESEKNKEEFSNVSLLWDKFDSAFLPNVPDSGLQWKKIEDGIQKEEEFKSSEEANLIKTDINLVKPKKNKSYFNIDFSWLYHSTAWAISLILLFYIILTLPSHQSENTKPKTIAENSIKTREIICKRGERINIILSDGSKVYLNSESKLSYNSEFGLYERVIELVGEAYFCVSKDYNRPFIVNTGKISTIVTGTEFNIKNRNDKVDVVVTKGSVKTVSNVTGKIVQLTKGDMISFSETKDFFNKLKVNLNEFYDLKVNKFTFSSTNLVDVMSELERNYNIKVHFQNDSLKDKKITGVFNRDSLDRILSVISLTLDLKIDRNGNNVFIK